MLWSVWTSTFMPFFNVFVATGNCCASLCACAPIVTEANTIATSNPRSATPALFMDHPQKHSQLLETCRIQKMFYRLDFSAAKDRLFRAILLFFSHQCENSHWATRAAFEFDRRGNQECAVLRQIFQVGQIFELIYASAQRQMMHGKIRGIAGID